MTFIASVIARDGIAIVADSFTTTVEYSMDSNDFKTYIQGKEQGEINIKEIIGLFQEKASYTRDYTDKLVKFDDYTAITSAGHANINGRRTKQMLLDIAVKCDVNSDSYKAKNIIERLEQICDFIRIEAVQHITNNGKIGLCVFIVSHYDLIEDKPKIFKIRIVETNLKKLEDNPDHTFIGYNDESIFPVTSDGQDKIVDRLLFGVMYSYMDPVATTIANKIFTELNTSVEEQQRIMSVLLSQESHVLKNFTRHDYDLVKIRVLSLQEAVNLAALLIRIVRDLQLYTEKIPTVGGLIKLAIVNKDGFKYISGYEVSVPNIVH